MPVTQDHFMPITYNNAQPLKCDNTQPLKVNVKVHDSFADVGVSTGDYFFQSRKVSAEFRRSVEAVCHVHSPRDAMRVSAFAFFST